MQLANGLGAIVPGVFVVRQKAWRTSETKGPGVYLG